MAATVSYHEVVCKGSPGPVHGLMAGLALGAGLEAEFWFHDEHDIVDPAVPCSLRHRVARLHLLPQTEVCLVVSGAFVKLLRAHRKAIAASDVCEIEEIRRIKSAQVAVHYHTYARRYDDEVRILLKDLPRGVKLVDAKHEVHLDPEAEGIEAYSATHPFESRGQGVLTGRFDLVADLRDRLDVHPLITCDKIELVTG